ncbi:hypothetical protein [Aquibium sp. ELW1220]|uniref:hypothetical protein n=1 Tax=Aquibium sp. ELW1220 TaxID=2976766 RepID=UPI0025B18041|nr:hypothetical protein [Aquibium sp. ELW1220]MDN2582368.1 hypothetical protein [Aquibium sp. ELW1220]
MKILAIRPAPPGTGRTVAHFDLQLTDDIRMFGMKLVQAEDGRFLTYAPSSHGARAATFSTPLNDTITRAACAAFREGFASDRTSR